MNSRVLEILVEERSMDLFLQKILPKILPADFELGVNCHVRIHEGKSDLQKSLERKMRAYPRFGYPVSVLVLHDQDSNDCIRLKQKLEEKCSPEIPSLIRIACRELENWYLGDFSAIEKAYPKIKAEKYSNKAKFRNPDNLHGAEEMRKLLGKKYRSELTREIAPHLNVSDNRSPSFNHFVTGLSKLLRG